MRSRLPVAPNVETDRVTRCGDQRPAYELVCTTVGAGNAKPGKQLARSTETETTMSTRPDAETKKTEREDAQVKAGSDRPPTAEEEAVAESLPGVDEDVADNYKEMAERGANAKGEGRID
jgi:hypothetical protein